MLYPGKKEISTLERTGLSIVLSMGSVLLIVLFMDEVLAFNTTPINIICALLIFSLLALCVWKIERFLKKFFTQRGFTSLLFGVKGKLTPGNIDSIEKEMEDGE